MRLSQIGIGIIPARARGGCAIAPQEMKGSPSFHAKLFFLLREPLPEP
jgi:hypothetical protein